MDEGETGSQASLRKASSGKGANRHVGMPMDKATPKGQQHDLDVKPDGPMLDVVQIVLDALFE